MAWIESHQALGRHPKLLKMAGLLRIHRAQAIGHLHFLWWWALDYAPYGDVSALTSAEIAAASEWPGDVHLYHKALQESGWIDENGQLHDWMDYAGKLVEQRRVDRDRKRLSRGSPVDIQRTSDVPNPTQQNLPNQPKQDAREPLQKPTPAEVAAYAQEIGFSLDGQRFVDFYESKGWKVGKTPMKSWRAAVRTWKHNGYGNGGRATEAAKSRPLSAVPDLADL